MNVFIEVILIIVFAVLGFFLGFFLGCFACLSKIEQLEAEKKALKEWLKASQDANRTLVKDLNETRFDLEAVVNGKSMLDRENET